MIKNGKFFLTPSSNSDDFKQLFRRLAAAGAGRPVDNDGFASGPWTPDLLAEAITQIDANGSGIDLRTVQLWFQDNDKGISADNIRWLARIFGCDDPDATSAWQAALSAAQSRLTARRRERKSVDSDQMHMPKDRALSRVLDHNDEAERSGDANMLGRRSFLANRSEALFSGTGSLNLPIAIWASGALLWFLVFFVRVHSVSYSPVDGLEKQVGFLWAPSWTVDRMIFVPLFIIAVTGLLNFWKMERRQYLEFEAEGMADGDSWAERVGAFAFSFWAVVFVSLVIVFLVQWSGVYLRPLLNGTVGNAMVDWILVAIVRPDVVTITEAIVLSGLANLYSAFVYWCYFTGLLLIYAVVHDFREIFDNPELHLTEVHGSNAVEVGTKITRRVFCCTVFGIFSATCIKLNAVYLISDAENILTWLIDDAFTALGLRNEEWGWLSQSPSAFMTSFFVLFITCFIFFICLAHVFRILERVSISKTNSGSVRDQRVAEQVGQAKLSGLKMSGVVLLLAANFFLIGQFTGFAILLAVSALVAIYSLVGRT